MISRREFLAFAALTALGGTAAAEARLQPGQPTGKPRGAEFVFAVSATNRAINIIVYVMA